MVRSTIVAFLAGCVTSGTVGYFYVHQDIYRANGAVNDSIISLASKVSLTGEGLEKRVSILEETVKELASEK